MIVDKHTLNCNGRLVSIDRPMVMGIINVTPDSFYSDSRVSNKIEALQLADQMLSEGADILDIGAASTRPGAQRIEPGEELDRLIPIIGSILEAHPSTLISVDTYHADVAAVAVNAGASFVNDVSAGRMDKKMYATVAQLKVPYILMHMQGEPSNMQTSPVYENAALEVLDFFIREIEVLRNLQIPDIIIDPGFGFGKTIEHNYELLNALHTFRFLECPILVGLSRKSMIYKPLNIDPQQALNGTTALHMKALLEGAKILRVHDVTPAIEAIKLWELLENNQPNPGV